MTSILSTSNLSLYTVPAAWWLCIIPHVYAFMTYDITLDKARKTASATAAKSGSGDGSNSNTSSSDGTDLKFEGSQPRTFLSRLASNPNPALTPALKERLARAEAASQNGYENLGFFAASVVAANISLIVVHANEGGGSPSFASELWWLNAHSLGYLVSRAGFNWVYIAGVSGPARGVWFYSGVASASALFIHAGNALRKLVK